MFRHPAPLTAVEPDVYLSRGKVFETDDSLKRLVRYDSLDRGCVSSALVSFNHIATCAETSDGLIYRLIGKPSWFWDVVDVWDPWFNNSGAVKDVTERMLTKSVDDDNGNRIEIQHFKQANQSRRARGRCIWRAKPQPATSAGWTG